MKNPYGKKKLVFADVFAGCGGLSLGLLQAGLRGCFAIEKDKFAFETLKPNLLTEGARFNFAWPVWLPIEPLSIRAFLKKYKNHLLAMERQIDVLVGGPPCQGFSSAGRRKRDDPRNDLFEEYLTIVNILKPRAVLIENVRGFTIDFGAKDSVKNFSKTLVERLAKSYEVYAELLELSQFGVPQARTRYFVLALEKGIRDANPFDRMRANLPAFLRSMRLNAPVRSWAAISDLEVSRGGTRPSGETPGFDEIQYTRPRTYFQRLMGAGEVVPTDLRLARHSEVITARFSEIIKISHAEGRLNTSISNEVRTRFGLKKRALRVLDPDRPSPTITSLPDDLLHYSEPRTLTVRETARLQTFPDWFSFKGKYTSGGDRRRKEVPRFTQVANAVPPLVARAFGELLVELLCVR